MQLPIKQAYSFAAVRELEDRLYGAAVVTPAKLMARAAQAACAALLQRWPTAKQVLILCGSGNNAGDGYMLVELLRQQSIQVQVIALQPVEQMSGIAADAALQAIQNGVDIIDYDSEINLPECDVIVDAILGIGQSRPLTGLYAKLVSAANLHPAGVLSLDVPSGINSDTGRIWGEAIFADSTITFLLPKVGLLTSQGLAQSGYLIYDDLDVQIDNAPEPVADCLTWQVIREKLPLRAVNAHKGDCGHVLVIGGDYGMGGAVRLAAEAALRLGAGKVTVATRPEHVSIVADCPELMCHQVTVAEDLTPLLDLASVVVVGPGLGQTDWSKMLWAALKNCDLPMVVDADALNLLAKGAYKNANWLLTPHPGEAARLLDSASDAVQQDRFAALSALQTRYGGVVVLKGAGSLIGVADHIPSICMSGNPGMASGGMGDLLSGILGALLAEGLSLADAARVGVLLHAKAADVAALENGERGLLATDVLLYARQLANPSRREGNT